MSSKSTKNPIIDWGNKEDEDLLSASIEKPSLFEVLVDRYQNSFYKTALGVVHNREEAEDIVQNTFVKIYFKANTFRKIPNASFKSWAYRILLNTAFVHFRKIKRKQSATAELEPNIYELVPDPQGEDFKAGGELKNIVSSVLVQMPKHLQSVLSLYYLEGRSYKNIAEKEKTTVSAVKMRLFRARKLFKKTLLSDQNNEKKLEGQEINIY